MSRLSAIFDDATHDGDLDPGEDVYAGYTYLGKNTIVKESRPQVLGGLRE